MDKELLIAALPRYQNKKVLIKGRQDVSDIVQETLDAHNFFESDYDKIAYFFVGRSSVGVLERLFNFLKLNVRYKEESERNQQTKSPAAILETGVCDCKCYALFIGGVLDALNRQGMDFDWNYAYASYTKGVSTPAHVFVQCDIDGQEYWVDPVLPAFNIRTPLPAFIKGKKKVDDMALYRVTGVPAQQILKPVQRIQANPAVGSVTDVFNQYPLLTTAAVVAAVYFLTRKRRR